MKKYKIILNLDKSINNFEWEDKKELEDHIEDMKDRLWKFYNSSIFDKVSVETQNRFYDILDMFNVFEVKESD